ncbi:MAG: hypothetical protein AAF799_16915 [Myxococcota bacterium]
MSSLVGRWRGRQVVVSDLTHEEIEEIEDSEFDVALAASSFEPRARSAFSRFRRVFSGVGLGVLFEERKDDNVRRNVDVEMRRIMPDVLELPIAHYARCFREVRRLVSERRDGMARVLVDYSCFPKPYYVGMLSLACLVAPAEVVFVYDLGQRDDCGNWDAAEVDDIYAIPGFEGAGIESDREEFLIGLGYDGAQSGALLEVLQPHAVHALLADPGVEASSVGRVLETNSLVLEQARNVVRAPLEAVVDVATAVRELVPRGSESNFCLVPLGPKPHALALGVVALLEASVTYLHVMSRRPPKRRVLPQHRFCGTRVLVE